MPSKHGQRKCALEGGRDDQEDNNTPNIRKYNVRGNDS